jgi:hypothetical protein
MGLPCSNYGRGTKHRDRAGTLRCILHERFETLSNISNDLHSIIRTYAQVKQDHTNLVEHVLHVIIVCEFCNRNARKIYHCIGKYPHPIHPSTHPPLRRQKCTSHHHHHRHPSISIAVSCKLYPHFRGRTRSYRAAGERGIFFPALSHCVGARVGGSALLFIETKEKPRRPQSNARFRQDPRHPSRSLCCSSCCFLHRGAHAGRLPLVSVFQPGTPPWAPFLLAPPKARLSPSRFQT